MYAITILASEPSDDLFKSIGKPYRSVFWQLDNYIEFVSDIPFSRGDLVNVKRTPDHRVFILEPVKVGDLSEEARQSVGLLVPLATDTTVSKDTNYGFELENGVADILSQVDCESDYHRSHILLAILRTEKCQFKGWDKAYNEGFTWFCDYHQIFVDVIYPIRRGQYAPVRSEPRQGI